MGSRLGSQPPENPLRQRGCLATANVPRPWAGMNEELFFRTGVWSLPDDNSLGQQGYEADVELRFEVI